MVFALAALSDMENIGKDIPMVPKNLPSVVTTSDAGAGVGYTGIRIRGSDATRVNITINGFPFNDAESHGTYWVNLPDFVSSVEKIQVQRGVGTSTNGSGAFGASINIGDVYSERQLYLINESVDCAGSVSTKHMNDLPRNPSCQRTLSQREIW